jgi:hypothetical protein
VGSWVGPPLDVFQGFIRDRDGNFSIFAVPGATDTSPQRMNDKGEVAGFWLNSANQGHGFVRDRDGRITSFEVPGAESTIPVSINAAGEIAGYYDDSSNVRHGFIRFPEGRGKHRDDCREHERDASARSGEDKDEGEERE